MLLVQLLGVPKLTKAIGQGNHDLTNKRNQVLGQGVRLGFDEQKESHRARHCYSTTNLFWQMCGYFFPKPREPSCFGEPL